VKVLISGASGLIGTALKEMLEGEKHEVWRLVRRESDLKNKEILWDPENRFLNAKSLEGFDVIINLNGENIAGKRWSKKFKKILKDSRLKPTKFLADIINQLKSPPKVFISGSAMGFYGNRGNEIITEASTPGEGFLPELSMNWEKAAEGVKCSRVVLLRTSVVLSEKGGALKKMLLPFKMGLGGKLGSGKQFMSWISLEDECRAIYFCMQNENISGPVNLASPQAVTNEEFTIILAAVLKRPAFFSVPVFILRLLFGDMADQALLTGINLKPQKLLSNNFKFKHQKLSELLPVILGG
jgi:uncharacterized protein (TIGR01777 family)